MSTRIRPERVQRFPADVCRLSFNTCRWRFMYSRNKEAAASLVNCSSFRSEREKSTLDGAHDDALKLAATG